MGISRRDAIKLAGAAAAATVMPMPLAATAATMSPALPMWCVGTPGEYDAQAIAAPDARSAFLQWAENEGFYCPEAGCDHCGEQTCECDAEYYARRVPYWDKLGHDPTPGDWLDAGLGHPCERCGDETDADVAHNVNGDAICHYCMSLADWKIADPERYDEIIDELLYEEYGI